MSRAAARLNAFTNGYRGGRASDLAHHYACEGIRPCRSSTVIALGRVGGIPDELARQIIPEGLDPSRQALEDIAVEAYRAHRLTGSQLRRLLSIPSRNDLDAFLKKRGVWLEYTVEDFRREGEITAPLLAERGEDGDQRQRSR